MKAIIEISAVAVATILSIAYVEVCMAASESHSVWHIATHIN